MIYLHPRALEMLKTMNIKPDPKVRDMHPSRRSWKERLFSLPWKPFQREKLIYCPSAYIRTTGPQVVVYVSPKTYRMLKSDFDNRD